MSRISYMMFKKFKSHAVRLDLFLAVLSYF